MSINGNSKNAGINRRQFVQYSAASSAVLGAGAAFGLLFSNTVAGKPDDPTARGKSGKPGKGPRKEFRTYMFDLRHLERENHDFILVAGQQRQRLKRTGSGTLRKMRRAHPILNHVPDEHFTHHLRLEMPRDALQLCHLQRVDRRSKDGSWHMGMMFTHHPSSALKHAHRRAVLGEEQQRSRVHVKWKRYGITEEMRAAFDDPLGESIFKETSESATTLVAYHPELLSGEPNSAAHIHNNIIGPQATTGALADYLAYAGDDWATMTELVDEDTGLPYRNSAGDIQYVPEWSEGTATLAGEAMKPALTTSKNDTSLGVNVSGLDPTDIENNDDASPTNGAIWTIQDGMATVEQSGDDLLTDESVKYQFDNQTPGHGYRVVVDKVIADNSGSVTVDFKTKNNYVRYLALYVRYLDSNGNAIRLSDIASEIRPGFINWDLKQNGEFDAYLEILNPQWNFFGIAVKTTTATFSVPVPSAASSILVLGGGLGTGSNHYPDTTPPGVIMTTMYNIAVPGMMLALGAAAGYAKLTTSLQNTGLLASIIPLIVQLFADIAVDLSYNDPDVFNSLVASWATILLKQAAGPLLTPVAEAIAEGLEIQILLDAIPYAGPMMSALVAIGLTAELIRTSVNVSNSPRVYVDTISLIHNIEVTVSPDPKNPAGFPAVADYMIVTLLFNNGSPIRAKRVFPGTTVTEPITVNFGEVPVGGLVQVNVGVYSKTGWVAGYGQSDAVQNSPLEFIQAIPITITENQVPIDAQTKYFHKESIVLDSEGQHIWRASTTPPDSVRPNGQCDNVNGHICGMTGITVSTINASVGYSWEAYNTGVRECTSGALSQLYQFANISITENPQSGYLFSNCGFSGVTRVVYDLLGRNQWNFYLDATGGKNYIRQIRLSPGGVSSFDDPNSNKAFGRLQFSSSALLLHSTGKIISISANEHKLEVLNLPQQAVADADAPLSEVRSGEGQREGLMDGPIHAALTAQGVILVLEEQNKRIQAFDTSGNPVSTQFDDGAYWADLYDPSGTATYLDLAVEYSGYLYVLSYTGNGPYEYHLDIYTSGGAWLTRTTGINADKLAVNYWRDIFTLNYDVLTLPDGSLPARTEPSVSHWIPSTPTPPPG
jgi:hypothetical protein